MATKPKLKQNALTAVSSAISTLASHKEILYPFAVIAFIQLFILEILYFYPRPPLKALFEPIISRLHSPEFMHYPANLALLPQLFQSTQIPMYILINSFFIGSAILIIVGINEDKKLVLKKVYGETLRAYIHLVLGTFTMFLVILGIFKVYGLVFERALAIGATAGWKFWIKSFIVKGAPFFQFFISVLVTSMFAYVIPAIMVDKRKIFSALVQNFKVMFSSFFFTLFVVLIPSLLYVVVLLLRMGLSNRLPSPEWNVGLIVLNIFVLILIDAIVYTAVTAHYLLQKENS